MRVKFKGSCLKQDKVTITHGNVVNYLLSINLIHGHEI